MRRVCRRMNPLAWSARMIKCVTAVLLALLAVVFLLVGLQPRSDAQAANYPTLEISAIDLETPVEILELQDGQLVAPATIAGAYQQSLGTTMIIGHSATVFHDLWQVEVGDDLTYNNDSYQIKSLEYVPKLEVDMSDLLAARTVPTLVLMTCAGEPLGGQDYSERLIIIAEQARKE